MHILLGFVITTDYFLFITMFNTFIVLKSVDIELDLGHHRDKVFRAGFAFSEEPASEFLTLPVHCLLKLMGFVGFDTHGDRFEKERVTVYQTLGEIVD